MSKNDIIDKIAHKEKQLQAIDSVAADLEREIEHMYIVLEDLDD